MSVKILEAPRVRVGRILSESLRIWLRNFVPLTFLYVLIKLPAIYLCWGSRSGAIVSAQYGRALDIAFSNVAVGALAYGVLMEVRGQRVGIGRSIRMGLKRLAPVLGVCLVVAVVVGVGSAVARGVPGFVLQCMLYVAVPVAIVEAPGVWSALHRSRTLTKDNRLKILGVVLLIYVAAVAVGGTTSVLVRHGREWTPELQQRAHLIMWMAGLLTGPWQCVAAVVTYHHLRLVKEGVGAEELATVFD